MSMLFWGSCAYYNKGVLFLAMFSHIQSKIVWINLQGGLKSNARCVSNRTRLIGRAKGPG